MELVNGELIRVGVVALKILVTHELELGLAVLRSTPRTHNFVSGWSLLVW
jgi:hypothetical protein